MPQIRQLFIRHFQLNLSITSTEPNVDRNIQGCFFLFFLSLLATYLAGVVSLQGLREPEKDRPRNGWNVGGYVINPY